MTDSELMLPCLPSRGTSLVVQTVKCLRKAIADGIWTEYLPGERALSKRMGVSRPTLRQALQQIERDGLLVVSERKRRRITRRSTGKAVESPRQGRIAVLMPEVAVEQLPFQKDLLEVARKRLEKKGFELDSHITAACFTARPARALQELTENHQADAWLLVNAPPHVQAWFVRQHIPTVVSGSCAPGTLLPSVDIDHGVACRHAVGVLYRSGKRHIVLLLPKGAQPGDVESENGFLQAVSECPNEIVSQIIRHEESVEGLKQSLDHVLSSKNPPDGFIVALPLFALTALMHLLKRSCRVPENTAVIARSDDSMLGFSSLRVSCYRANAALFGRQLADEVIRVAESGFGSARSVRQLPVYVEGETV